MMTIDIFREYLDYDQETGQFIWKQNRRGKAKIGTTAGTKNKDGYLTIRIKNVRYYAHRLAWLYVYGVWPSEIDHKNQIKDDNRIDNLRETLHFENSQNRPKRKDNKSGFRGVYWDKTHSKWKASIQLKGKRKSLGSFDCPVAASEAYQKAAAELHTHRPIDAA